MTEEFEANEAAIAAQMEGEDILELTDSVAEPGQAFIDGITHLINHHSMERTGGNTPDFVLAQFLSGALKLFGSAVEERSRLAYPILEEPETTLGFYVDGYSVHSTPNIGEIRVIRYDGKEAIIKSASLTAYFDRRIDPPNTPKEGD